MAINLQKGQRVDLTKGNPGLSRILIGLGWDPVQQNKGGGLFGSLLVEDRQQVLTVMHL